MKVAANDSIAHEIARVKAGLALSGRIARDISNLVDTSPVVLSDVKQLRAMSDRGARVAFGCKAIGEGMGTFETDAEAALAERLFAQHGQVYGADAFADDPYLSRVQFASKDLGRFGLSWAFYEPYQLLTYDVSKWVPEHYLTAPCIAYFEKGFKFPCFFEGDDMWMSITPNEIVTMREPVERAQGRVLTLGCGMGYYAYLAARKPEVESVTVIELERDVIDLFEQVIRPNLDCADKINVVQADAYEHMKMLPDGLYDYVFADTWIGAGSVDEYLRMRSCCAHLRTTQVDYWIEDAFLNTLLRLVAYLIADGYGEAAGVPDPALDHVGANLKRPFYRLRKMLSDVQVETAEDVQRLMTHDFVLSLLASPDFSY